MPHLIYASSSSVYGLNEKIPFSESDPVEKPSNLYGATKRANELMAYSYFHLFGIRSVGFRFFTVYGPWGRPDMAAYLFMENISQGKAITVYNNGQMKRDFTYVDDIVTGISSSLNYKHDKPAVFNLGNNKPVEALYFLELIEKHLGMKATIKFEDSRAEIAVTYANTSLAMKELGFVAKTSIEEGLEKFLTWYKERETALIMCESGCHVGTMCTKSAWESVIAESQRVTSKCSVVVYTAALSEGSAGSFSPSSLPTVADTAAGACYLEFVSASSSSNSGKERKSFFGSSRKSKSGSKSSSSTSTPGWTTIAVSMGGEKDILKLLRVVRISPRAFFAPSVTHAVFVDRKLDLTVSPFALMRLMQSDAPLDTVTDKTSLTTVAAIVGAGAEVVGGKTEPLTSLMLLVRSPRYQDIPREAQQLLNRRTDDTMLSHQLSAYRDYQERQALNFTTSFDPALIVHDLRDPDAQKLRCRWYKEAQEWPDVDAISGAFVLASNHKDTHLPVRSSGEGSEWVPVFRNYSAGASPDQQAKYVRLLPMQYHWQNSHALAVRHTVKKE